MPWSDEAEECRDMKPRELPFWQLLDEHSDEFEERYDDLFSRISWQGRRYYAFLPESQVY